jgi:hypothetical protein
MTLRDIPAMGKQCLIGQLLGRQDVFLIMPVGHFGAALAPSEDDPRDIGPLSDLPCHEVGPGRMAGHRGRNMPLVHAKILVLGQLTQVPLDEDHSWRRFEPQKVWVGPANWTAASSSHLEIVVSTFAQCQRALRAAKIAPARRPPVPCWTSCAAEHPFRRIHVRTPTLISWRSDSH